MQHNKNISITEFKDNIRELVQEVKSINSTNVFTKIITATQLFNYINNNCYIIINETKTRQYYRAFIDAVYDKSNEFLQRIIEIETEQYILTRSKRNICSNFRNELNKYGKIYKVIFKLI